ncbi:MAG: DUF2764 family protein [Spirochaetota bacterium]
MAQYYYAVSTLPMLFFEGDPAQSEEFFLDFCRDQLTTSDFAALETTRLLMDESVAASTTLGREWFVHELGLRNTLVSLRASGLGWDEEEYLQRDSAGRTWTDLPRVEEVVRAAVAAGDPLKSELALDRYRWELLDELEVGHYFDLTKLQIYYLKLQLLRRKALFGSEVGQESFDAGYEEIRSAGLATAFNQETE